MDTGINPDSKSSGQKTVDPTLWWDYHLRLFYSLHQNPVGRHFIVTSCRLLTMECSCRFGRYSTEHSWATPIPNKATSSTRVIHENLGAYGRYVPRLSSKCFLT